MNNRRQWVAIELDFVDNPKILKVGALGGWAHLQAIIYAARHRTDGFIPNQQAWIIFHMDEAYDQANSQQEAAMVEAGLWHPVANGYMIHDYLEHQTKAETMREKRARAGRLGGLARAANQGKQSQAPKLEVEEEKETEEEKDLDQNQEHAFSKQPPKNGHDHESDELDTPAFALLHLAVGPTPENLEKLRRTAAGLPTAAIVAAREAAQGPGVLDPLAVALATLTKTKAP